MTTNTVQNTLDGWCIEKSKMCSFANYYGKCQLTVCINPDTYTFPKSTDYIQDIPEECPLISHIPPACRKCPNYGRGPCWCILGSPQITC